LTLGEYIERMLDTSWDLRASSLYGYRHVYARHIAPELGRWPIGSLTTEQLRSFFSGLPCGPSARAAVYRLLAKALNLATREGVLDRSPLKAIPRPRTERKEIRPLPIVEIETLADAIEPRYRLAVLLGGYLGLRAGRSVVCDSRTSTSTTRPCRC
jgi:integrase